MKEKEIERRVCQYARKRYQMLTPKFISPSNAGMPDRIILTNEGVVAFIEFKAPGGRLTPLQHRRMSTLTLYGFDVYVVDDEEKGTRLIDALSSAEDYKGIMYGFDPAKGERPSPRVIVPAHVSEARRRSLMDEPEGDAVAGHGSGEDGHHSDESG